MSARLGIGIALIVCGTFWMTATLGVFAFIVYQVFHSATNSLRKEDWAVPFMFLALLVGVGMVMTGVIVGVRRPKEQA